LALTVIRLRFIGEAKVDAGRIKWAEQEVKMLAEDGSEEAAQRALMLMQELELAVAAVEYGNADPELRQVLDVLVDPPLVDSQAIKQKLKAVLVAEPWMALEQVMEDVARIVGENASAKSKRRKVIAIANRITAALAPHVACKPGCSQCCHMNTVIYEHEAIRLAEVTGRKMVRLPFRTLDAVHAEGLKFNGKRCPFLVDNKCSVYEDRPLQCRTHHSLSDTADLCSMDIPEAEQTRPPMYDPDLIEGPYREMNIAYRLMEPCGNIREFFPD
jgi:Fe-S-cluster containining protein